METTAPAPAPMTPAQMVEMFIKLRDEKKKRDDEHKKSTARISEALEKLEGLLLANLQQTGAQSLAVKGVGTVYRSVRRSASVQDRDKFLDWVADAEAPHWEALDAKVNMTYITECIEKGTEVPDFIKVSEMATVGVQRK